MSGSPPAGMRDLGRHSEPALHVLISLAAGPKHGYAIQDDIAELTGDRPGPGTLYGAIRRLEERALIEALPEQDRRKPYQITDAGRRALQAELARMRATAAAGQRRLAMP
jgi:DNA-binding PadR family transcriptional regulator